MHLHRYRDSRDLPQLLAFCSAASAAPGPLRPTWHPGDLVWQLRGHFESSPALYAVVEEGRVAGVFWIQGEELSFDLLPARNALLPELFDAAKEKALEAGINRLRVSVDDSDTERQTLIAAAEFSRAGPGSVYFERDLILRPAVRARIDGFRLRDCVDIDPEARAEVHRAAWSALEHIGIKATSTFSSSEYLSLITGGAYDPRFDIVAETEDGRLAATATAWADPATDIAVFEPVGVRPEFRGRDLLRAVMTEAMIRIAAAGVRKTRVATTHFNAPAIASYTKSFDRVGASSVWSCEIR